MEALFVAVARLLEAQEEISKQPLALRSRDSALNIY